MVQVQPRLKETYRSEIVASMMKKFGYKSPMEVPVLEKIVVNQGLGKAISDKKIMELALEEMGLITGQKPVICKSKKDISNFKVRKGMPIGAKVTLRKVKMYEFLDRLIALALPRTRDFRGISATGFDGRGNYNMGVKEQIIFPEIDIDKVKEINGMDITFVTSANTDEEARALLTEFGLPFKK